MQWSPPPRRRSGGVKLIALWTTLRIAHRARHRNHDLICRRFWTQLRAIAGGGADLGFVASEVGSFERQIRPIWDIPSWVGAVTRSEPQKQRRNCRRALRQVGRRRDPQKPWLSGPERRRRPEQERKMGWRPKRALKRFSAFRSHEPARIAASPEGGTGDFRSFPIFRGHSRFSDEFPASFRRRSMSHDGT